jgi:hypothetical protein
VKFLLLLVDKTFVKIENLTRFREFSQAVAREKRTKRAERIGAGASAALAGTADVLAFANMESLPPSLLMVCGGVTFYAVLLILGLMVRQAGRMDRFTKEFAEFVYPYSKGKPIPQEFANEDREAMQTLKTMAKTPNESLEFKLSTLEQVATWINLSEQLTRNSEILIGTGEAVAGAKQETARLKSQLKGVLEESHSATQTILPSAQELNVASHNLSTSSEKYAGSDHQMTELTEIVGELEEGLQRLEKSYGRTQRIVGSLKELDEAGVLSKGRTKHEIN